MMNTLITFFQNHGTKVLGYIIMVNTGIAGGTVALPPPLNAHSATTVAWALFLNFILGGIVVNRGFGNTQAIATVVSAQHEAAIAKAAATGTAPVVSAPGNLAPKTDDSSHLFTGTPKV